MDQQTASKVRLAAIVGTVIALAVMSIPFMLEQRAGLGETPDAMMAPLASHDAGDGDEDHGTGACMADAKPANMDFVLPDLDGNQVPLSSFRGKVILLNFWATWCGPCKAEVPIFVQLQEQYPDDLVIIGFSVDDTADKARAFAEEFNINYPVLLGLGHEAVQDAYGPIWGIPTSFVISRDGRVCKKHMGIAPRAVFERDIRALL
jgi:cytochrome c biogenesis protein CcmG/thiol:disulfide interchange protein DsbE